MKLLRSVSYFGLLCILGFVHVMEAQDCDFITPRFDVDVQEGVFYGVDTTFDGRVDSLFLDIYVPDNEAEARPMVIWCFGGGFFTGSRSDFAAVCEGMAAAGYVAVTIDYRLGYVTPDILDYPFAFDDKEIIRAGYRAMQDLKGAIRYMKSTWEENKIDLDHVYIGGGSAGAITALAAAFIDRAEDKDLSVLGDVGVTNTNPPIPRQDLGAIEGRLNLGEYDASVNGVINIFGAVFDTAAIEAEDEMILYSYHQTDDPVVPCEHKKAYHGFPFVPNNMPFGYGSCVIEEHLDRIGWAEDDYETFIHQGNQHSIHDEPLLFQEVFEFLEYHICESLVDVGDIALSNWAVFPNPVQDILHIQGVHDGLWVVNSIGQLVGFIPTGQAVWYRGDLPSGLYHLVGKNGESASIVLR